ncbi:MAG TPA: cytochrome P450 [Solirubrobacterales bacterium]|jgi:cytochrome P450|nr:cytochrome P450 [Solirubrobacterales bacterium]
MAPTPLRTIEDLPGPRGLPLLGNLHQIRAAGMHQVAERWSERYGPIYRFDIGGRRLVAIADPDVINTVLRDRPDGFRRWSEIETITEEIWGNPGVFAAEGDEWRRARRLAVTALNSNHLQRYFEIVATCTRRLHRRLEPEARAGRPIEIGAALSSFTVDVTSALAFGRDLNTLEHGDDGLQEHLHRVFHATNRRLLAPFPYWRYVKLPADRELDRSVAVLRPAVVSFMEEARERIAARPELREAPENFLEGMVAAQEKDGTFDDEEILANVFTLLLAGEDTTSHTMAWTIDALATRPEVQARWAEEARDVLGDEPCPAAYETVERLDYGEGVLREAMRLKSVAPIGSAEPLADTEVAGIAMPAGTKLLLLTRQAGLRDVARAADFRPERWLPDEDLEPPDQKSFLTFGAGPRFCPGRNLAFLEAKTALAMIARNFEISLDPTAEPVTELLGFTMSPKGLRVRLRERTPAAATV